MEAEGNKYHQPSDADTELEAILIDLERQWIERTGELHSVRTCIHETSLINSEVLANMGHEIAKPLSGVIGLARLMLESELDCNQKMSIETIIQSCHALLRTLDNIIDSSMIEEGHVEKPEQLQKTASTTALIDSEYVSKLKSDFPDHMVGSLLQQYCSDSEQTLTDLEYAVDRGDFSTVKNLLHLLKGCSANFGACAIVEFCNDRTKGTARPGDMGKADMEYLKQTYEGTKNQLFRQSGDHPKCLRF